MPIKRMMRRKKKINTQNPNATLYLRENSSEEFLIS